MVSHVGAQLGPVHGKAGKAALLQRLRAYAAASHFAPWIVLVDLDRQRDCAPALRANVLPEPMPDLCFRIAVRSVEAWLLADRAKAAAFLGVARARVPRDPESLEDPKRELVNLARASRWRAIREELVPDERGGRLVGPGYTARMSEFASTHWRPEEALRHADSLRRAIDCLQRLVSDRARD